jgi:5-methylcytosine-specific restriction endonuclease McrA
VPNPRLQRTRFRSPLSRKPLGEEKSISKMDPRKLFADERFTGLCAYCGATPDTRDHVPSKVLLDEPLPADLPVVSCCHSCNDGFSLDEQYLACFVECVIRGSVEPDLVQREKVKRILRDHPALAARIAESSRCEDQAGNIMWLPQVDRVGNVVLKLARGHSAYKYSEPQLAQPKRLSFIPISLMSEEQLRLFETPRAGDLFPEIGSRAFLDAMVVGNEVFTQEGTWTVVQEGRYRYSVSQHSEQVTVRFVLSEYLACEVTW